MKTNQEIQREIIDLRSRINELKNLFEITKTDNITTEILHKILSNRIFMHTSNLYTIINKLPS